MKKILFLIHDLGVGGAEKVLVNLVNHMDKTKFDISVIALFGGGVNERFLSPDIHYRCVFPRTFPGNSKVMKLFSPKTLHRLFVKEQYDIEISYLEGPSARVISGCRDKKTKLVSWIHHTEQHTIQALASSFRNETEARNCYTRFDQTVCVSRFVMEDFCKILDFTRPCMVLYNTIETDKILQLSKQCPPELKKDGAIRLVAVGKLSPRKGTDRILRIVRRLLQDDGIQVQMYFLGIGPQKEMLEKYCAENGMQEHVTFLGYQTNPYQYVANCDLLVCASYAEGFSTAATEALVVGTPVCTTDVSGMKEMLGENNEYGIVTSNDEEALYQGIKTLLTNPELLAYYRAKAAERGKSFHTENTVRAVEAMLENL